MGIIPAGRSLDSVRVGVWRVVLRRKRYLIIEFCTPPRRPPQSQDVSPARPFPLVRRVHDPR